VVVDLPSSWRHGRLDLTLRLHQLLKEAYILREKKESKADRNQLDFGDKSMSETA
jgi:hypothetical protein